MKVQSTWWHQQSWRRGVREITCFFTAVIYLEQATRTHSNTAASCKPRRVCRQTTRHLMLGAPAPRTMRSSCCLLACGILHSRLNGPKQGCILNRHKEHRHALPNWGPLPWCWLVLYDRRLLRNALVISFCREMQAAWLCESTWHL